MEKLYLDLAIVLFFLAALVMVSQTRKQMSPKSKDSFNLIATGICFFSLLSTFSMLQNQLATLMTISISATAAVEFMRLTFLISGLVFVTSGVSKLLPSMGLKKENNESTVRQIGQLKRLGKLISTPSSFDNFIRESLEVIADNVQISAGAVYAVTKTRDSARLMAAYGVLNNSAGITEKFVVNPIWMERLSKTELTAADVSFSKIYPDATGYCHCFPMTSYEGRTFLYLLWIKEKDKVESLDPYILERLNDSLNTRLTTERLFLSNDFNRMFEEFAKSLRSKIALHQSANEMFMAIKNELQNHMPVEFISICTFDSDGAARRISIGQSGTVLKETDISRGLSNSYLNRVIESQEAVLYKNIENENAESFPELFSVSRIKSLVAIPLQGAAAVGGVLTIGAEVASAYRRADMEILKRFSSSFEAVLNELVLDSRTNAVQQRVKLLKALAVEIADADNEANVCKRAAGVISKAVGCSMVRISTVDREDKFLHSQALIHGSTANLSTPGQGHLILSLLNCHRTVLENGDTVLTNCGTGKQSMTEIETKQVFSPDAKKAALVPIKVGNRVLGIISLADDKVLANTVLTSENIQFVETIASITAVSLGAGILREEGRLDFTALAKDEMMHSGHRREMRNQIKSSLTSIIGSVDMIKSGGSQDEIKRDKFIAIIDKSARRLTEYLSETNR